MTIAPHIPGWPPEVLAGRYALRQHRTLGVSQLSWEILVGNQPVLQIRRDDAVCTIVPGTAMPAHILSRCDRPPAPPRRGSSGPLLWRLLAGVVRFVVGIIRPAPAPDDVFDVVDAGTNLVVGRLTRKGDDRRDVIVIHGPAGNPIGYLAERGRYPLRRYVTALPSGHEIVVGDAVVATVHQQWRPFGKQFEVDVTGTRGRLDPRLALYCAMLAAAAEVAREDDSDDSDSGDCGGSGGGSGGGSDSGFFDIFD